MSTTLVDEVKQDQSSPTASQERVVTSENNIKGRVQQLNEKIEPLKPLVKNSVDRTTRTYVNVARVGLGVFGELSNFLTGGKSSRPSSRVGRHLADQSRKNRQREQQNGQQKRPILGNPELEELRAGEKQESQTQLDALGVPLVSQSDFGIQPQTEEQGERTERVMEEREMGAR